MKPNRPATTRDLSEPERRFLEAMTELQFGHFDDISIERGEIVLSPWPKSVRQVKFSAVESAAVSKGCATEFQLKAEVAHFFAYVRSIASGEIRRLEVRHGLPQLAEVEQAPNGGRQRD